MRSVIVPLYWLWCGVSVFILVRRRVKGKSTPEATASPTTTTATSPMSATASPTAAFADVTMQPPPEREPVSVGAPPAPVDDDPVADGGAVATETRPRSETAAAVALGVPMSTVDSLAEALEGIALPCDLAPLIGSGDFDPRALVLVTEGRPAEVIGTALADEMEGLGFALEPLTEQSILATNDRASVEITIYGDASVVDDTGARRFPTASPDAVVVDIRLR